MGDHNAAPIRLPLNAKLAAPVYQDEELWDMGHTHVDKAGLLFELLAVSKGRPKQRN